METGTLPVFWAIFSLVQVIVVKLTKEARLEQNMSIYLFIILHCNSVLKLHYTVTIFHLVLIVIIQGVVKSC